jgi:hypothetical protein
MEGRVEYRVFSIVWHSDDAELGLYVFILKKRNQKFEFRFPPNKWIKKLYK